MNPDLKKIKLLIMMSPFRCERNETHSNGNHFERYILGDFFIHISEKTNQPSQPVIRFGRTTYTNMRKAYIHVKKYINDGRTKYGK